MMSSAESQRADTMVLESRDLEQEERTKGLGNRSDAVEALARLLDKVDSSRSSSTLSCAVGDSSDRTASAKQGELPAIETLPVPRLGMVRGVSCLPTGEVLVLARGAAEPIAAELASEVSLELVELAIRDGQSFLVEWVPGAQPVVVGVIQTRLPRDIRISAETVEIDARKELLVKSGRAALRLRSDGDVELVGSRISAVSHGLFRLVGRMLRLN